jgi:hypothetical protein
MIGTVDNLLVVMNPDITIIIMEHAYLSESHLLCIHSTKLISITTDFFHTNCTHAESLHINPDPFTGDIIVICKSVGWTHTTSCRTDLIVYR